MFVSKIIMFYAFILKSSFYVQKCRIFEGIHRGAGCRKK
jgi:hypothetical protein